jgi:hypothetical protein
MILNMLRFSRTAEDFKQEHVDLRRLNRLVRQGRVKAEPYKLTFPARKTTLYSIVISDDHAYPFQCTGSFCHQLNFTDDRQHKLCRPCRDAKLRHNRTERTRPTNVHRANKTRRICRYNNRMQRINRFPWLTDSRPRGVELVRRIWGWTRHEAASLIPIS